MPLPEMSPPEPLSDMPISEMPLPESPLPEVPSPEMALPESPSPQAFAYHGWGFGAAIWHDWQQWLSQRGYQVWAGDRGYFYSNRTIDQSNHLPKILLLHSFGLHLCPIEQLQQAELLIIFSSFATFHPAVDRLKARSQRMLQQMIDRFETEPNLVLYNFLTKCYHPQAWNGELPDRVNLELLQQDLQWLNQASLDVAALSLPQTIVLHGSQDRIVAVERGQDLADRLSGRYFEVAGAGHALPFTHLDTCVALLDSYLKEC